MQSEKITILREMDQQCTIITVNDSEKKRQSFEDFEFRGINIINIGKI